MFFNNGGFFSEYIRYIPIATKERVSSGTIQTENFETNFLKASVSIKFIISYAALKSCSHKFESIARNFTIPHPIERKMSFQILEVEKYSLCVSIISLKSTALLSTVSYCLI